VTSPALAGSASMTNNRTPTNIEYLRDVIIALLVYIMH
jgi:hypothetical protein